MPGRQQQPQSGHPYGPPPQAPPPGYPPQGPGHPPQGPGYPPQGPGQPPYPPQPQGVPQHDGLTRPYTQQMPPPPPPPPQYAQHYRQPAPPPPPPPPPMPPPPMPPRQWQPPPRRKSGMGVIGVLGAVFGSMAALFVLIVVGAALLKNSSRSETTTPVAIPTYEPTPERSRATREPTRQPTPRQTRTPDETVTPPAQVRVDRSLKNNSLYRGGALPRINCRAGNASIFSHSQLKSLILKTAKCMDRAWGPVLEKQGFDFRPPGYAIASGRGRGACGDYPSAGSMVPYYCPRNSTIYASTSAMARGNGSARGYGQIISWHGGIISMMAHEYGHHVQNVTGLMNSWWDSTLASSSRSAKLGLSRRLELQATCLGGMWMRSVAASYPVTTSLRSRLYWFYGQVGDYPGYPRDHGTPANNNRWFRQGWEKNKPYQCNTWMAPASTVS